MSISYYLDKKPDNQKLMGKIFIVLMSFVLVGAIIVFVILGTYNAKISSQTQMFSNHLEAHNYDKALDQYRKIQSNVLAQPPDVFDNPDNLERQVLEAMEELVNSKLEEIQTNIRYERYIPTANDRAFLEGLGELTGSKLAVWMENLCEEFLLGTIEKPTLMFVFEQIGSYNNLAAAAEPLVKEISNIEMARGEVQTAEKFFEAGEYIKAIKKYQEIVSSFSGFVLKYTSEKMVEGQQDMYLPMLEECITLLKNHRYYTAENILTEMVKIFPDDQKFQNMLVEATSQTFHVAKYKGEVKVLSFKPLLVDPVLAFASKDERLEKFRLTLEEFNRVLETLYEQNYILIDIHSLVNLTETKVVHSQDLFLPENKKPLILVFEDFNYSGQQVGQGINEKLILNELDQICGQYRNAQGQLITHPKAEAIGLVNDFIDRHPDFSFDGAKGILTFTGYESVFGYIVNEDQIDDYNDGLNQQNKPPISVRDSEIKQNQETVLKLMNHLKQTGWWLASSTYGFINAKDATMESIKEDTTKWLEQVGTLTGAVDILVYPNGNFINGKDPRSVYLKDLGMRIFLGIGLFPYRIFGDNYFYMDRMMVNQETLNSNEKLNSFLNPQIILDPSRSDG